MLTSLNDKPRKYKIIANALNSVLLLLNILLFFKNLIFVTSLNCHPHRLKRHRLGYVLNFLYDFKQVGITKIKITIIGNVHDIG
jgi:hypothetical protein